METGASRRQSQSEEGKTAVITWRHLARFLMFALLLPALLFATAGTLHWAMGWAYTLITLAAVIGSRLIVMRRNPELLKERARALEHADAKKWDRVIVPIVGMYGPLAMLVVSGLDRRFGWTPAMSLGLQLTGLFLVMVGSALGTGAMVANRFFSAVVRIQKERGHAVVSSGPYSFVRHPGYAGGVLGNLAIPLALGSIWALIPGALTALVTVVRTILEDRTLQAELDGYSEYAQRVRYRLLPGIW